MNKAMSIISGNFYKILIKGGIQGRGGETIYVKYKLSFLITGSV